MSTQVSSVTGPVFLVVAKATLGQVSHSFHRCREISHEEHYVRHLLSLLDRIPAHVSQKKPLELVSTTFGSAVNWLHSAVIVTSTRERPETHHFMNLTQYEAKMRFWTLRQVLEELPVANYRIVFTMAIRRKYYLRNRERVDAALARAANGEATYGLGLQTWFFEEVD